jgi:hypothetical protein
MTTTGNKEIQLTATELEMIKLQREKAELEAKEKELKHKQELDKRVELCEKQITEAVLLLHKQREAVKSYLLDLNNLKGIKVNFPNFILVEKKVTIFQIVTDYRNEVSATYWKKSVDDIEYKIGVVDERYIITVSEHKVYTSKWSRSAVNKGFHMFLHGGEWKDENKAIKSAKTMLNKIEAYIENENDKKKSVDRAELAKEMALARLSEQFPELDVKYEVEWHRSSYNKEGGYYEYRIVVTLENGKTFKFSYNLFKVNELDTLKVELNGWAGFDYIEVIRTISALKQVK